MYAQAFLHPIAVRDLNRACLVQVAAPKYVDEKINGLVEIGNGIRKVIYVACSGDASTF